MSDTQAYLCEGLRTPIGRYGGTLSSVRPDDLLAGVMRNVVASVPNLDPAVIEDAIIGCANQAGEDNRDVARMSVLLAGLPDTIGGVTVNRLCGSGLDAIGMAARAIRAGEADLIMAGTGSSDGRLSRRQYRFALQWRRTLGGGLRADSRHHVSGPYRSSGTKACSGRA